MSEGTGGEPLRAPDPPLRSQAVVAARWTGVQLVVGRAVTVATTILLARALLAEELGVIAILTVALNAGFLVQEFGTGSALIYRGEDAAATAGFVLAFQLAVGLALAVIFVGAAGPLGAFRYDITQAGVDAAAVGAGSSSAGLEDFISLHASVAPSAFELGYPYDFM